MKNLILLISILLFSSGPYLHAQNSFSTDFESYNEGDWVAGNDPTHWRTWSSETGGTSDDAKITSERAASGTKSFKIQNTVTGGGPEDLILKLGEAYTTGTVTLGFKMFIEPGGRGYFNLQSGEQPGLFGLDFFFQEFGEVVGWSHQNYIYNTSSHPIGEWFDCKMVVDPANNMWTLSINNQCIQVYRGNYASVSGVDFFANPGTNYFIDDVYYNYDPTPVVYIGAEAGLINLNIISSTQIKGFPFSFSNQIYNAGTETIHDIDYKIKYQGVYYNQHLDSLDIEPGNYGEITSAITLSLPDGLDTVFMELVSINGKADFVECNNFSSNYVFGANPSPNRKVILESSASTTNGASPVSYSALQNCRTFYNGYYIPIAVHFDDPMAVPAYQNSLAPYISAENIPQCMVDRDYVADITNPDGILGISLDYLSKEPDALINIGAKYGTDTSQLKVSVTLDFTKDVPENYSAYLILKENGVHKNDPGFDQANYFANNAYGPMGGFENLPDPVPASQMIYNDVARFFDNSKTNFVAHKTGDAYTYNYSINIPADWEKDSLTIVAVLLNNNGIVSNANDATIAQAIQNGYIVATNSPITQSDIKIYPNPATGSTNIALKLTDPTPVNISIQDMLGRVQYTENHELLQGEINLPINLTLLTPGTYQVLLKTESGTATSKLIIVR